MILDEYELKLLHYATDNDEAEALFRLRRAYLNISSEYYNQEEAEKLLRQATELGHVGAKSMLGSLLLNNGNQHESIKLLTEAAENGNASAAGKLGTYYRFRNDYEQAVKWLEKAGKQDEYAYYQLSLCYEEGCGVKKDIHKAKKCGRNYPHILLMVTQSWDRFISMVKETSRRITARLLNTSLAVSSKTAPMILLTLL